MVLGYMCQEHDFVNECDLSDSGDRICQTCGKSVTGVTGRTRDTRRSPPEEESHAVGTIRWTARNYKGSIAICEAFDFQEAAETLVDMVDNPQDISEIRPMNRKYAHL